MSLFLPVQRASLLIPTGQDKKHLFILLTNPTCYPNSSDEKHTLLVGISSVNRFKPYDGTCYLHIGDHPFVKQKSYVNYRRARIEKTQKLIDGCKQGIFTAYDTFDTEVCARVAAGLLESPHASFKVQKFYRFCSESL